MDKWETKICLEICAKYNITEHKLFSGAYVHRGPVVAARQEFMFRLRSESELGSRDIARRLGLKDGSGITKGIYKHCIRHRLLMPRSQPYMRKTRVPPRGSTLYRK